MCGRQPAGSSYQLYPVISRATPDLPPNPANASSDSCPGYSVVHKRSEPTRRPQDLRGGHGAICREFWGPRSLRASLWGSKEDTTCGSAGKESACNAGDLGLIPGLGRSPGEGKGYALQYSGLENTTACVVPGLAKSQT